MYSPELNTKLALDSARPAKLAASDRTNAEIVDEVYLLVYCRLPRADEAERALAFFTGANDRRAAVEDLFWALLNTPEFLFID